MVSLNGATKQCFQLQIQALRFTNSIAIHLELSFHEATVNENGAPLTQPFKKS